MGSGEPALVPEWLRGAKGGRSPNANSDDNGVRILSRNRLPLIPCGQDSRKSSSGRNSSKGSEAYSNFGRRKNNDPPSDRARERSLLGNIGSRDYCNSVTVSRTDSDRPWRNDNHAGVLGRHGELCPKEPECDSISVVHPAGDNVSGSGIGRSSVFKRDFPKLASVEEGGLEMDKVSSAVENIALPTAAGDRWTSVLAEVPVGVGDNASTAPVSAVSLSRSNSAALNMAEVLIQASSRARTAPQLSSDASRTEELTLKQCMQLIPVTPSMPKTSGLNSSEIPKFRGATKNGQYVPQKCSQKLSPQLLTVNNALRASAARSDAPKASQNALRASAARSDAPKASQIGNFQVLCREKTGVISPIAANDAGTQDVILKSSINPNRKAERKGTNKSLLSSSMSGLGSFEEKKPQSLAQNRSDFFNSLRKKTSVNHSIAAVVPEPSCCDTMEKSLSLEQNSETSADIASINLEEEGGNGYCTDASVINQEGGCADGTSTDVSVVNLEENAGDSGASCGDGADASSVEKPLDTSSADVENDQSCCSDCKCHLVVDLDEREKAFLRSLGWEEDAPDEALTEEEIATFVKQYQKVRPLSQVLQSLQSC